MLLTINIPTYERYESFCEVLKKLVVEINRLDSLIKEKIQINILDNNSKCYLEKEILCKQLVREYNVNIKITKNKYNNGASMNVHNCYISTPETTFTWVLGDDDHILDGALTYITEILIKHIDDLGLLIINGGYSIHPEISNPKIHNNYFELALKAVKVQPYYLIAHTLISCNIYRTSCFNASESLYTINTLYKRYGHWTGFPHMRGLVFGLLRTNKKIIVAERDFLDLTKRVSDVDIGIIIFDIYFFYFLWILSEIGVKPNQIKREKEMDWFFHGVRFKLKIIRHRLNIKVRVLHIIKKLKSR